MTKQVRKGHNFTRSHGPSDSNWLPSAA